MRYWFALAIVALVSAVAAEPVGRDSNQKVVQKHMTVDDVSVWPVSMVRLLAKPEAYDGKELSVQGFLVLQFKESNLFLSASDATYGLRENSLAITLEDNALGLSLDDIRRRFHGKYVKIDGRFDAGGVAVAPGLSNLTCIRPLTERSWKPADKK